MQSVLLSRSRNAAMFYRFSVDFFSAGTQLVEISETPAISRQRQRLIFLHEILEAAEKRMFLARYSIRRKYWKGKGRTWGVKGSDRNVEAPEMFKPLILDQAPPVREVLQAAISKYDWNIMTNGRKS